MTLSARALVFDTARLLGANTVTRVIGIIALVFYARLLSPSDLAALPVFLLLGAFTTIPFNLGLYPTLMRDVPRLLVTNEQDALGMIRTTVLTIGVGVIIAGFGYAFLSPLIARVYLGSYGSAPLVLWMVTGTVLRGWDEMITFVMRATREVGLLTSKKLISEIGQPVLALALLPALGVRGMILGQTLGLAVGLAWGAYGVRRYLFRKTSAIPLGPLVRRSRPYYLEGFVFFLTQQGDQALVGALLSPTALAAYYVARRVPDALGLILYSVEEVMGPTLSRAAAEGQAAVARAFRVMTMIVGAFVLPAGVLGASLASAYVTLVGRASYGFVIPAVVILSLATVCQGGVTVTSQAALALGHPSDRLKITVTFAVLLLALTAVTAQLGLTAVAVGRGTAIAFASLVGFWLTRDVRPPVPWNDLGRVVAPAILLAVTVIGLQSLSNSLWLVPVFAALGATIFGAALYFSFGPERRRLLIGDMDPMRS